MQYFIGIVAPPPINEEVLSFKKYMEEHYGCKVALRSPAHITLVPPFNMATEKEVELVQHLATFSLKEKSFLIRLQNFGNFKPRVIFVNVLPDTSLLQIKDRLDDYLIPLKGFSFKKEDRPFHPHVTIANRDLRKSDFHKAWAHFRMLKYEASFIVSGISLLRHNKKEWEIAHEWRTSL